MTFFFLRASAPNCSFLDGFHTRSTLIICSGNTEVPSHLTSPVALNHSFPYPASKPDTDVAIHTLCIHTLSHPFKVIHIAFEHVCTTTNSNTRCTIPKMYS
ncbi:hypothetical protein BDM02DRAFT_461509 [Thelephora ganbajun]|uniref:Uncharacterized protein n=1 Tax=Thelephora ganbajun TaxID=370292 RepID=A0ACB6ZQK1_THEGA|nr:hypothetical protein BDM02DRAFT_461509 [Thelephora ganbajun]